MSARAQPSPPTALREPGTPWLARYLAELDDPCPNCRSSLRGLRADRCPECGQPLELGVRLTRPRLAAFVAGLVGLAMGTGFFIIFFVFAVFAFVVPAFLSPTRHLAPSDYAQLGGFVVGIVSLGVPLVLWARSWAWLRRRSELKRRWLVIAAWVWPASLVIVAIVYTG